MSFCEDTTWQKDHSDPKDPIHQHADGRWFFFDETWAYEHGPFDSREDADKYVTALSLVNHQVLARTEKG